MWRTGTPCPNSPDMVCLHKMRLPSKTRELNVSKLYDISQNKSTPMIQSLIMLFRMQQTTYTLRWNSKNIHFWIKNRIFGTVLTEMQVQLAQNHMESVDPRAT